MHITLFVNKGRYMEAKALLTEAVELRKKWRTKYKLHHKESSDGTENGVEGKGSFAQYYPFTVLYISLSLSCAHSVTLYL